jgi:hypothetical protein
MGRCASELLVYPRIWKEGEDHAISRFEIWAILYARWQWKTMDRIKILDEIEELANGTWAQQVEIGNYMKAISQGLWVVAVALYHPKGPTRIKEIEYWNVYQWMRDKHLQGDLDKWWEADRMMEKVQKDFESPETREKRLDRPLSVRPVVHWMGKAK